MSAIQIRNNRFKETILSKLVLLPALQALVLNYAIDFLPIEQRPKPIIFRAMNPHRSITVSPRPQIQRKQCRMM